MYFKCEQVYKTPYNLFASHISAYNTAVAGMTLDELMHH